MINRKYMLITTMIILFLILSFSSCTKNSSLKRAGELIENNKDLKTFSEAADENGCIEIPFGDDELVISRNKLVPINHGYGFPDILSLPYLLMLRSGSDLVCLYDGVYIRAYKDKENFGDLLELWSASVTPSYSEWKNAEIVCGPKSSILGEGNAYWYNPVSGKYEDCIYISQSEEKADIYIVYQKVSLFTGNKKPIPYIMSEEMMETVKTEASEFSSFFYAKGTIDNFLVRACVKNGREIPDILSDIEGEFFYFHIYLSGYRSVDIEGEKLANSGLTVNMFLSDMKNLGIDTEDTETYVIHVSVPYSGDINDVVWELNK